MAHSVERTRLCEYEDVVGAFVRFVRGGCTKFDAASHEELSDEYASIGVAVVTIVVDVSTAGGILSAAHLVVGSM